MAARAKAESRLRPEPQAAGGRTPAAPPRCCGACQRELRSEAEVGWECECGVVVCAGEECIEEYFKPVAGGEAMRCLSCGLLL